MDFKILSKILALRLNSMVAHLIKLVLYLATPLILI